MLVSEAHAVENGGRSLAGHDQGHRRLPFKLAIAIFSFHILSLLLSISYCCLGMFQGALCRALPPISTGGRKVTMAVARPLRPCAPLNDKVTYLIVACTCMEQSLPDVGENMREREVGDRCTR